jgi:hypothetical protein
MKSDSENTQQISPSGDEITEMYAPENQNQENVVDTGSDNTPAGSESSKLKPVTWSAEEYIQGDKNILWYIIFAVVALGLIAVDVFLIKSYTFSILTVVMATAVVVYASRPPRTITYALSVNQGLYIEDKLYRFDEFKAFGVIKDGDRHSIMLIPVKRFSPGVSVYFPEESGELIVDILGSRLPMENLKLDLIDILVRKLRL